MEQPQSSESFSYAQYAPLALRAGLAVVFFLFGLKKLTNPTQATAEIQLLLEFDLADAAAINFYLGLIELLITTTLIVGFKVRVASAVAGLLTALFFLSFLIKYGFSINPDLYRDVGLFGAATALFLLGAGPLSLDHSISQKERAT